MYSYIKGTVTEICSSYIVIETGQIGYQIFTANPYAFELNKEYKVYLYQHIREDEQTLYGFKTTEEKELFLKLIDVKGLGCKMALPMLATGSINGILDAIERENVLYLKKFPKIGDKVAKQIILDLKGKVSLGTSLFEDHTDNDELKEVLKGLGYKPIDINRVVKSVDKNKNIEEQIKEALKLLLK